MWFLTGLSRHPNILYNINLSFSRAKVYFLMMFLHLGLYAHVRYYIF